jgi:hypothetical protein
MAVMAIQARFESTYVLFRVMARALAALRARRSGSAYALS